MSRLFILEGLDSTGKSTLSKSLAHERRAAYFHAGGHRDLHAGMYAHHCVILESAEVNLENGLDVVIDRLWPSELAYATVLRPQLVDKYVFAYIRDKLRSLDVTYIYCYSENVIEAYERYRVTHLSHDHAVFKHLTPEQYSAINTEYRLIFDNVMHVPYRLEVEGKNIIDFIKAV